MTPDAWRKLEELYSNALPLNSARRAEYLTAACGSDEALRNRVEEMLRCDEAGAPLVYHGLGHSSESDSTETVIMQGMRFGAYEVTSRIGAGGMGTVYEALDTRLGRKVAIKVSKERYGERFEREARAIAAISHPFICTLYDIGPNYLIMELVEGEPLSERIRRGAMPVEEVLRYGFQIASALAEAHAQGIIHRDLKPANIMVTRSGVKLLDFGLAKITSAVDSNPTESNMVLGTPAYMSPEQAKGEAAGPGADLFALGLVLYEMVEGKPPVPGGSLGSLWAHGSSMELPPLSSGKAIPASLRDLIRRLLERSPEDRPGSAVEVRDRLAHLAEKKNVSRVPLLIAAAIFIALSAGIVWWILARNSDALPEVVRMDKITSLAGDESEPAFSPNGRSVAFVWGGGQGNNRNVYVIELGSQTPRRLTEGAVEDVSPEWSPDGKQIAFMRRLTPSTGRLLVIPAAGGAEKAVQEFSVREENWRAARPLLSWTPDGRRIIYSAQDTEFDRSSLFVTGLDGTATRLFPSEEATMGDTGPRLSPDGKWLAYVVLYGPGTGRLFARRVGAGLRVDGVATTVSESGAPFVSSPAWDLDSKRLYYTQGSAILAWRPGGKPRQIYRGTSPLYCMSATWQPGHILRVAMPDNSKHTELYLQPLKAGGLEVSGTPAAFDGYTAHESHPQFSPDGRYVTFLSSRSGATELWAADANGKNTRQLTQLNATLMGGPTWSRDGRFILLHARVNPKPQIYIVDAEKSLRKTGEGARKVTDAPFGFYSGAWSPDGKYVYVGRASGQPRIFRIPVNGGAAEDLFEGVTALVTVDGHRFLYARLGHPGVYARSLDGDVAANPEERLVEDYRAPGYDLNMTQDGFYYIGCDDSGRSRAIRFYNYTRKTALDVAVIPGIASYSRGLAIAPDRRSAVYQQNAGAGSDLNLIEFK